MFALSECNEWFTIYVDKHFSNKSILCGDKIIKTYIISNWMDHHKKITQSLKRLRTEIESTGTNHEAI